MSNLALEQGRRAEALDLARTGLQGFERGHLLYEPAGAALRANLALALLANGKTTEALVEIVRAEPIVDKTETLDTFVSGRIASAIVRVASGEDAAANLAKLEAARVRVEAAGDVYASLRIRRTLGELELATGRKAEGRRRLVGLEREARERGYLLIARKAHEALERRPR